MCSYKNNHLHDQQWQYKTKYDILLRMWDYNVE